jgi:RNA-directed DNA polymerase
MEHIPAAVPIVANAPTAKQAGEAPSRWTWVEPSVWTERMLTALETGVKGGHWFSLIDKVYSAANLRSAAAKVAANGGRAGVDHVTTEQFIERLDENVEQMKGQLREGTFRPQAIRRAWIPKLGSKELRPLGIPTVRDRTTQAAIRHVIEPIFERDFAEHSYGFRPQRGCKDALRRVDKLLKQGYTWVVDADLKSYFDTIPHDKLLARLMTQISDSRVLKLIEAFVKAGILEGVREWTPTAGAPQGAVLSPLLSNVYLDPLDHLMAERGFEMVRYADDFVILCRTREEAEAALALVQQWVAGAGLTLHPEKTRIVDEWTESFDFLGYKFLKHRRFPRKKSLAKFREAIWAKTPRQNGHSLSWIIADVNRTLRGWFEYFKHSRASIFVELDKWVRMRLRSILRKRIDIKGRGGGYDHWRWPNAFFAKHGLFSLVAAHAQAAQSSLRLAPSTR